MATKTTRNAERAAASRTERLITSAQHPLIGARVHVDDEHYSGPAIVLEYDPTMVDEDYPLELVPFYCHLLDLCLFHEDGVDEGCDDPADECWGEACRGWYAIKKEG
jgi:hypothetical protein